ncbi:rRNA maturation RNase YbeY [Riemerella columbipharyngis]|uniref:Endoribonuclease YbeY n=1 Tax=Riemerella columbipharyngis TaxID=1071918 RepID=A0A1G7DGK2_9FLAO|nr:rRNA maturation RNase YbeY [Riemerella columbipharyngis]SDE50691.1 rRNA maturation RNase YbeY [Riemerella columbipharyngis]
MIQFFFESIEPTPIDQAIEHWLKQVIVNEHKKVGDINYILCDDDYLLKINQDYLQHDYYTDIITFDYVKGSTINGDIFVSLSRISDNASTLSKSYDEEFRRVLVHGILHLCGYKDKTEQEASEMRNKEDEYLNLWNTLNNS